MDYFDRDEREIERAYEEGEIDHGTYYRRLQNLRWDHAYGVDQAEREAYERERGY